MSLSQSNPTERFTDRAELYARCRPDYSAEAVDFVVTRCGLKPGDSAVDVGSGTGIFSRLLAVRGIKVIGIEPNDAMRQKAILAAQAEGPAPDYRKGTGEEMGLPDEFADAVVCAQAFHWLKAETALKEFHRILKRRHWTALCWNERNETDPFTAACGDIIRSFPNAPVLEAERQRAGAALLASPLFEESTVKCFTHAQELTEDQLVGRAFSASYAPTDPVQRRRCEVALRSAFQQFACDGIGVMRYVTTVYTARRPD